VLEHFKSQEFQMGNQHEKERSFEALFLQEKGIEK